MSALWLVGAGSMAQEYAKVLCALGTPFQVIGNRSEGCERFQQATGITPLEGGVARALEIHPPPDRAIVAVGIDGLAACLDSLLCAGVGCVLLEKPGVGYAQEMPALVDLARNRKANVLLAYNRRFYEATRHARRIIAEEGGVRTFFFEFTEWSHQISKLTKHRTEWENWFLGNSTHVVDLAFFLGGSPVELHSHYAGSLAWHSRSANFAGSGRTASGALFSYLADWSGPGRWGVEFITAKSRLIFRPMEKLSLMEIGSVAITPVAINDELDIQFKPGLYLQTQEFLAGHWDDFVTLPQQSERLPIFCQMAGYEVA